MAPVQASYTERMRKPTPGTIAGSDYDTKTGIVETAAGIGFGLAVGYGTTATKGDQAVVLGGTLAKFRGISVKDVSLAVPQNSANVDKYLQYNNMAIITRGEVWASPAAAVAPNDAVHFDTTTGRLSNTGGIGPIKGAYWMDTAAQDGAARVFLPGLGKQDGV